MAEPLTTANTPPVDDTGFKFTATGLTQITHKVRISLPPLAGKIFYKDPDNILLAPLFKTNGFLFPIQPAISIGYDAKYQEIAPTHSNFPYQMYQSSSMKPISLTGEFIVRNRFDAQYVNAGMHFLKSLTRMFNYRDAEYAGAPPHVVRVNGMGFTGFDNVPCVLTDVTISYPDSVDYITFQVSKNSLEFNTETARIPVNFTITVNLVPVFSRDFITNIYTTRGFSSGEVRMLGINEERQRSGTSGAQAATDQVNQATGALLLNRSSKKMGQGNIADIKNVKTDLKNSVNTAAGSITKKLADASKIGSKIPAAIKKLGNKLVNLPGQQAGIAKVIANQGAKVVGKLIKR